MKNFVLIVILACGIVPALGEHQPTDRYQKVATRMVKAINEQDYAGVGKDFSRTTEDFLPLHKRELFFKDLSAQYGKIKNLEDPRLVPPDRAVFVAQYERGKLDITVWLNDDDKITGLLFLPHKPPVPIPERNQTKLSLPFRGGWVVAWGGDTKELNQHHDVPNQKFAFDFLGVDEQGKTRKGEGHTNEDHFAFGREILAPADGTVTDVISGVRDNVPGSMNPYSALGNAVFIQHRENEVSVLAHLKLGSIKVKVGDKVKVGHLIGLCGNSGNSSEPHLHYHLQNTPVIQDATGIKCYFQKVIVLEKGGRESKVDCSPIKGEIVVGE
jgi:murein DD-endopeptidase MepM/ murein hydrolase activator NlpD